MPSTRQLVGGKEGLNKANDSTAITAERSILNIGIPVWSHWRGADGEEARGGGSHNQGESCIPARRREQQQ